MWTRQWLWALLLMGFAGQALAQEGLLFVEEDATREVFEELAVRLVDKANLPGSAVVAILPPKSAEGGETPKYLPLMEASLETILAARVKLADRSKVKEIEKEQQLSLSLGSSAVTGLRVGALKDVDYFLSATFTPAGERGTHLKLTLTDARSGLIRASAAKTFAIPPVLKTPLGQDSGQFFDYQKRFERAKMWEERGYQVALGGAALFVAGMITAPCQEKSERDGKKYSNLVECNRQEGGPGYNGMMTVAVFSLFFGGSAYYLGSSWLDNLSEEAQQNHLPHLSLAPVAIGREVGLILEGRF